jgi:hypothetical protein
MLNNEKIVSAEVESFVKVPIKLWRQIVEELENASLCDHDGIREVLKQIGANMNCERCGEPTCSICGSCINLLCSAPGCFEPEEEQDLELDC